MANTYFQFKQFTVHQDKCAMKVTTDGCLFGAWTAERSGSLESEVWSGVDIGTGTGLLSLMLAQKNTTALFDAIEIDENAAKQAEENIVASPWEEAIKIINADGKTFQFSKKYDLIISNPPFYENELKGDDKGKNTAHHDKGMLLEDLLIVIKDNLNLDGRFYLLLPYKRNKEIETLLLKHEFNITRMVFVKQSVKHDYFRIMLEGKLNRGETTETMIDEISIKDEKDKYTLQFVSLLKDYYLHL
jgi:tRNA1Val (adenine37-N6)-methyltransferase